MILLLLTIQNSGSWCETMKIVSNNFNIYLNNVYNFDSITMEWLASFSNVFQHISKGQLIDFTFKDTLNEYPKYPLNYAYVRDIGKFDILKVRELTLDTVNGLMEAIDPDIVFLKPLFDSFPELPDSFVFDVDLQRTYFTKTSDLYNQSKFFLNNYNFQEFDNLMQFVSGAYYDETTKDLPMLPQYLMLYLLVYLVPRMSTFRRQFTDYSLSNNVFTQDFVSTQFKEFITDSIGTISSHLCNITTKNIYSMVDISNSITDLVTTKLTGTIPEIGDAFETFLLNIAEDPELNMSKIVNDCMAHVGSLNVLSEIFTTGNIINTSTLVGFDIKENDIINNHLAKVHQYNIKSYLFMSYLYKFWPIKYFNVLSILSKEYVEREIMPISSYFLDSADIGSYMLNFANNGINIEELTTLIQNKHNFGDILDKWDELGTSRFVINIYAIELLDRFMETQEFADYIKLLLKGIFDELYDNGYVDKTFNWYQSIDVINLYFKSLFRMSIASGQLFGIMPGILSDNLRLMETQLFSPTNGEIPIGALDGDNMLFIARYQFDDATLVVKIDDVEIPNTEYISTGNSHVIMFNTPPSGTVIKVSYTPDYEITFKYSQDYIQRSINTVFNSQATANNITIFMKNMYLSTLSKQVYYNILDYFSLN